MIVARKRYPETRAALLLILFSLFLIALGMQVPDFSRPHKPTPRPRAIIETAVKSAKESAHGWGKLVAACCSSTVLCGLQPLRTPFRPEEHGFPFTIIAYIPARSPPPSFPDTIS
jgi:hypothetical protein